MGLLDGLAGIFGGGSSSSVSSNVNLTVNGLDDMKSTVKLEPVTVSQAYDVKPLTVTQNQNVDVKPLQQTLTLKPVTVGQTVDQTLDVKPLELSETVDLKPVVLDSTQTVRLAPLPDTTVCNPYHHHVAMSLFGVEVMAMSYRGDSEQSVRSPRRGQRTRRTSVEGGRPHGTPTVVGGRGLRIRVIDEPG